MHRSCDEVQLTFKSDSASVDHFYLQLQSRWNIGKDREDMQPRGRPQLTKEPVRTGATGLFFRGGKIESRLLKFCRSHATPLSGMAKCDLAKFKQLAVTFCLPIKLVRPRQCFKLFQETKHHSPELGVSIRVRECKFHSTWFL